MKTKTKQTIKKILAITGLGLLLTFALGSVAYLGYELAHKPTKAKIMAMAESETLNDLTGTTWVFNENYMISNFSNATYNILFTNNNSDYTSIVIVKSGGVPSDRWNISYDNTIVYGASSGWYDQNYRTIEITGGADTTNTDFITWLYSNATLESNTPPQEQPTPTATTTFRFAEQINYHAPYSQDIDSYFVADSTMTTSASTTTKTLLENIKFSSGGQEFDTIRARYISAQAQYYYTSNNTSSRAVWSASGFASYMWLEYYNSETNKLEIVNTRLTQAFNDNTSSGVIQLKGSKWVSANYRTITFIDQPTEVQITTLSTLNNTSANIGYYNNSDIGLGNAFTLLGQAFTSWAGLLSIQVLPNISLGLLIFLPLIVGIIILIIWVVKR